MSPTKHSSAVQMTSTGLVRLDVAAPLQAALDSPAVPALLHQVLRRCFTWPQRNDTTIMQASLSADISPMWVAALLAWDAQVLLDKGATSPLSHYLTRLVAGKGEAVALLLPAADNNQRWGMADVARARGDVAIVGAVAVVDMEDGRVKNARMALSGVWQRNVALAQAPAQLIGQPLTTEAIAAVATAIAAEANPRSNFLGSAEYRRAMAKVISQDALAQCMKEVN